MNLRPWLTEHPATGATAAAVCLVVAVAWIATHSGRPPAHWVDAAYFMNMQTGWLVALPTSTSTPTQLPDGATACRAHVFGCGDCGAQDRTVLYLEKLDPEAADALRQIKSIDPADADTTAVMAAVARGRFLAAPPKESDAAPQWVRAADAEGEALIALRRTLCTNRPLARECRPQ